MDNNGNTKGSRERTTSYFNELVSNFWYVAICIIAIAVGLSLTFKPFS